MSDPARGRYALPDGRVVTIARLLLSPTYAGALEGSPAALSRAIRARIADDVRRDLGSPGPVVALDDGQAALPAYRWAAALRSPTAGS